MCWIQILLIVIIIILVIIYFNLYYFSTHKLENMTNGTLTQLFANDVQDTYLKGNVDKYATGNYTLFWNQPTKMANTLQNRGQSLILPNVSPSKNKENNENEENLILPKEVVNPNISKLAYENKYNSCNPNKETCGSGAYPRGNGSGGSRLGEDFIEPTTKGNQFVNLNNGNLFLPDSYVGSYFIEPDYDIVKPYPYIPESNKAIKLE